ncbi:LAMI_0E15390g1_1 [Lachancea mirantina]|uniref:LAMI_0E15390g1_1 n=1 Tax=Lachancea mirantina TaxID=1230905 RepID=A0A1G4JSC8_9SACH|nr:LAMI_0E15390g1_1 [Lachancea mirantina]
MEQVLSCNDRNDSTQVNSCLVSYVAKCAESYNNRIDSEQDIYRLALILTHSKLFEENREFCVSKLLSLLSVDLLESTLKFIISYIMLCAVKIDSSLLELLLNFQGFTVVYNNLYNQFAYLSRYGDDALEDQQKSEIDVEIIEGMKKTATILIDILFQELKFSKCEISNIQIVDDFFVYYLMSTLRSDTTTDIFNNAKFKLLLALSEQYMISSYKYEIENKVAKYLMNHAVSQNFIGLLLLKFNRITDRALQIMMCKVVYLILTSKDDLAKDFFYVNDLHVFVDVLIRELMNISEDEELTRNTFLRVLLPLLRNTVLATTHYRKADLVQTLEYLSLPDNFCSSSEIKNEHKTTARLAAKCFDSVSWLNNSAEDSAVYEGDNSRDSSVSEGSFLQQSLTERNANRLYKSQNSSHSAESISKRYQPPPLPPARKVPSRLGSGQKIAQFRP